ncbi:MAG: hypothetical protein ACR2RE_20250, partial [Geminicoccaceae bacterium]
IGHAAKHAARAIAAGKFSLEHAVAKIQAAVFAADPGHRSADEIEDRAKSESIENWIRWHQENTSQRAAE